MLRSGVLARGQVLSLREKEFVEAARSLGASELRLLVRHILPNAIGPLIVAETLAIPNYISLEALLSFIGLGVNPPTPSWGIMIADGARTIRTYPHQALFPGLALALTMFAFNFLGDGLRDALDPRMQRATFSATRGVTIRARPEAIWPWLVQMDIGRAGWYSYDWIDNLGRPSAERILA